MSSIYVWDPRLGGSYGYGAYQELYKSGSDYKVNPGGGSYAFGTVTNYIQSGQAFMVQATGTNGTVSFTEGAKANGSALFTTPNPAPLVEKLFQTGIYSVNADGSTTMLDGVFNSFDDSYSNGIDGLDARKALNTSENLSIKNRGQLAGYRKKAHHHSK